MWRELAKDLIPDCKFVEPATFAELSAAEETLKVKFPEELRALLQESNGILDLYGCDIIWSIARIEADNLAIRSDASYRRLYMPFDPLLFFGDSGTGDQFAFAIHAGVIRRPHVFARDHEDDSRTWVAPSVKVFLEWWASGKIKY